MDYVPKQANKDRFETILTFVVSWKKWGELLVFCKSKTIEGKLIRKGFAKEI